MKIIKNKFKFIYLEITNHCNLSCPFCPSSKLIRKDYLDLIKFEKRVNEIKKYTDTVYLHILGEPLMHPNFVDIVKILNINNIKVRITTNGVLLKNYDFSKLDINKISISLQSLIKFNDSYIESYFKELLNFMNSIKSKLNDKILGIDFRIWNDKLNSEICEFNKKLEDYLYNYIKIGDFNNCRISYDNEFTWPDDEDEVNTTSIKCQGGKTHLGILVNGDVVLCCLDYLGKTKIGNIDSDSLDVILLGDTYQEAMTKMLGGMAHFKLCQKCKFRNKFN